MTYTGVAIRFARVLSESDIILKNQHYQDFLGNAINYVVRKINEPIGMGRSPPIHKWSSDLYHMLLICYSIYRPTSRILRKAITSVGYLVQHPGLGSVSRDDEFRDWVYSIE